MLSWRATQSRTHRRVFLPRSMKKPETCSEQAPGRHSVLSQRSAHTQAGSSRPLGRRHHPLPTTAHSILSPGLKSDILSGKTGPYKPQPPASSHIVQSTLLRILGHNSPLSKLALIYNTANIFKNQVFFSINFKNFFAPQDVVNNGIFFHKRWKTVRKTLRNGAPFFVYIPYYLEHITP